MWNPLQTTYTWAYSVWSFKKKKGAAQNPSSNWGVGLQGLCWWDKEKAFLQPPPPFPQEHTFCVLCLTKEFPNFGVEGGKSVVATGSYRAGFPPQKVKYKQKAKMKLGFSDTLEETPRLSVLAIKISITKSQRTRDSFSFCLAWEGCFLCPVLICCTPVVVLLLVVKLLFYCCSAQNGIHGSLTYVEY